jgi:hypothetical protein
MADGTATKGLRERLATGTEDRLGKALTDLFDNPLLSGALGRAADAREKATQAQELAMGALNLPSAADVERLTRRLRSISQRLEGIEDGVHRIGRNLASQSLDARLGAIEEQLGGLSRKLSELHGKGGAADDPAAASTARPAATKTKPAAKRKAAARSKAGAKGNAAVNPKAAAKPSAASDSTPSD